MKIRLSPIYPITDKRVSGKASHLAIVRELVRGGATILQIRDKETPVRELLPDIRRCVEYAAKYDVQIILNDRCDLALLSGAAGAHLGQDDLPPDVARRFLGRSAILGFSTHSLLQVREANLLPVQYIGFGPIFSTATKPNHSPVVGLTGLRHACHRSAKPVVAIGGIELEHVRPVLDAGAASAAVVSALMKAKNIARRLEELLKATGRA
jgi:thiamine-phosphate pyrophosphorylase